MDPAKWETSMATRILEATQYKAQLLISMVLMLGVVDQISGDKVLIEYKTSHGDVVYTTVSLSQSECKPAEGQSVYFYKDSKVVTCLSSDK